MQIKKDFFVKNRMYSIILSDMSMWELARKHARSDFFKFTLCIFVPSLGQLSASIPRHTMPLV